MAVVKEGSDEYFKVALTTKKLKDRAKRKGRAISERSKDRWENRKGKREHFPVSRSLPNGAVCEFVELRKKDDDPLIFTFLDSEGLRPNT